MRGYIDSIQLVQELAAQFELEWAPLNPFKLDPQLIASVPRRIAVQYGVLPVMD